jgi:hypothetical protein
MHAQGSGPHRETSMKLPCLLALLSIALSCGAETMTFDTDATGQPPAGWSCGATGNGTPKWSVEADSGLGRRVLKQSGRAPFSWCVKDDIALADGWVEVRFKPLAGREDRAGGLIWRWKDGDNYCVARANALENNVSLYHTTAGARRTIVYKDAPVAANTWHTLRVDFRGVHIRVALDGKAYIELDDTHIEGSGKAGVWTKADSVTLFDAFACGSGP